MEKVWQRKAGLLEASKWRVNAQRTLNNSGFVVVGERLRAAP